MHKLLIIMSLSVMLFSCNRQLTEETQSMENDSAEKVEQIKEKSSATTKEVEKTISTTISSETGAPKTSAPEIPQSPFQGLEMDIFGNKYIYSDIELIKLGAKGDTLAVFNTRNTSGISSVAVTNPNKLIVYSRDNQRSWTLDSTLSIIEDKTVDLPELGEIGFLTRLEGDDILYYSRSAKKFFRTNSTNEKMIESDVHWEMESQIRDIVESQDQFIVRNEDNEVYLFDSFGNLVKEIKVKMNDGPVDFQNNFIFQIDGNQLRYLDVTDPTAEFKTYKLSGGLKNVSDFKMGRQKIVTLTNGKVTEQKIMIVNF